ncbi:MAG: fumarylacetoacetate hydrolase family protein [Actinomycetia bacterium]|nr:fumarylacetoacetate hydrolase family protein [Actinomycetes bacterium]
MRIARIHTAHGIVGVVDQDGRWAEVDDILAPDPRPTGVTHHPDGVSFACPVVPALIVGMLHNLSPVDQAKPPQAFLKSPRTAIGTGDKIYLDPHAGAVKGEGELAVVIGRPCRFITPARAREAILGFTCANDVTTSAQIPLDATLTQAKNGDGYTPLGPWIETDLDPADVRIGVVVDGREVIANSTANLAKNVYEAVSYLSHHMTLGPGDVVLTGSPATSYPLEPGQTMSIVIEGLGTLTNKAVPHPHTFRG